MKNRGFTLIELIVVITILAILGTIAFIGFKGYTGDARNSKVTTDIANLHNSLAILKSTEGFLPVPDNSKTVTASGEEVTYEGEVGDNVRNVLKASSDTKTPDGNNYKYAVRKNQKDFTLVGLLEEETVNLSLKVSASSGNKSNYFKGGNVVTLFDGDNNFVDGDILALKSGEKVYLNGVELLNESNKTLFRSCKQILKYRVGTTDGTYKIAPKSDVLDVYCDMTTDGGGWTMYNNSNKSGDDATYGLKTIGVCDGSSVCSLNIFDIEFSDVLNKIGSNYIAVKGIDRTTFLEEIADTDGEISVSKDAQSLISMNGIACDVGEGKKESNTKQMMFEMHHGSWNPDYGINYMFSDATKRLPGYGISYANPQYGFSARGIICNGTRNFTTQDYVLFVR